MLMGYTPFLSEEGCQVSRQKKLCVFAYLWVLVGSLCGPTGSLSASTLHCILAVNTLDPSFGEGSQCNLCLMWEMCQSAAVCAEMDLDVQLITEEQLTPERIQSTLHHLSVEPDDTVLFYFNSHGKKTKNCQDPLPALSFPNDSRALPLASVVHSLREKQARLTLVFAEVCNHREVSERQLCSLAQSSVLPFVQGYHRLFRENSGVLVAVAAQKGQVAWLDRNNGSFFTRNLVAAIEQNTQYLSCSWDQVLNSACEQTVQQSKRCRGATCQNPYYCWESR